MHRLVLPFVVIVLAAPGSAWAQVAAADEPALLTLWACHTRCTNDHAGFLTAYAEYVRARPADPLAPVGQGLAAWHLLCLARTAEAGAVLRSMLSANAADDSLQAAARNMAQTWLTRLDRERVREALRLYYARHVEYPPSLDAVAVLPGAERPALTDRWSRAWVYSPTDLRVLKGMKGQRYRLESPVLKDESDLRRALLQPYAARLDVRVVKVVSTAEGQATVHFQRSGEQPEDLFISRGTESGGIFFAFMGKTLVVLSDGSRWRVVALQP